MEVRPLDMKREPAHIKLNCERGGEPGGFWVCPECGARLRFFSRFTAHVKAHLKPAVDRGECPFCKTPLPAIPVFHALHHADDPMHSLLYFTLTTRSRKAKREAYRLVRKTFYIGGKGEAEAKQEEGGENPGECSHIYIETASRREKVGDLVKRTVVLKCRRCSSTVRYAEIEPLNRNRFELPTGE